VNRPIEDKRVLLLLDVVQDEGIRESVAFRRGREEDRLQIGPAAFEELVTRALDELPSWVQNALDNVEVTVAELPSPAQRMRMRLRPDSTLLGLYEGVPQTRRTTHYGLVLPDKITLFRQPILAVCRTPEEVEARVRSVVVHELAHHFGIDDDRLRELGAY
jgi:predicted Zn-dependent protease with MMP-like domain